MDKKQRDAFAGRLRRLAEAGAVGHSSSESAEQIALDLFTRAGWAEKYREEHIVNLITETARGLGTAPSFQEASTAFARLSREYEQWTTEQIVFVPLLNLGLDRRALKIGNVTIRVLTPRRIARLRTRIEQAVEEAEKGDAETRGRYVEVMRTHTERWKGRLAMEMRFVATSDRAIERAADESEEIVDFLRTIVAANLPRGYAKSVLLGVESNRDVVETFAIASDLLSSRTEASAIGPVVQFVLTSETLKWAHRRGLFRFTPLLEKPKATRTEFEAALVQALHWFADSRAQAASENALVSLMVSLETLLAKDERSATGAVTEGIAFLLGRNSAERKGLRDRMRDLYRSRGKILHAGARGIGGDDLRHLEDITLNTLLALVKRRDEFETKQALSLWIDEQRMR